MQLIHFVTQPEWQHVCSTTSSQAVFMHLKQLHCWQQIQPSGNRQATYHCCGAVPCLAMAVQYSFSYCSGVLKSGSRYTRLLKCRQSRQSASLSHARLPLRDTCSAGRHVDQILNGCLNAMHTDSLVRNVGHALITCIAGLHGMQACNGDHTRQLHGCRSMVKAPITAPNQSPTLNRTVPLTCTMSA